MRVAQAVAFLTADGAEWSVPAGAVVDGASIPRLLWPIVGSPYTGRYRDASVIHDWFCSVRSRPSAAVHLMFHEAMLASGVSARQARLMYLAVLYGGPSWTEMDVENVRIALAGSTPGLTDGAVRQRHGFELRQRGVDPEMPWYESSVAQIRATKAAKLWLDLARNQATHGSTTVHVVVQRELDRKAVAEFSRLVDQTADKDLSLADLQEAVEISRRYPVVTSAKLV